MTRVAGAPALPASGRGATGRVLDPADRAAEILFRLIMLLTFTLSLGATGMGEGGRRGGSARALGGNLAWGLIDAVGPRRVGFAMVAVGIVLVTVALALGG